MKPEEHLDNILIKTGIMPNKPTTLRELGGKLHKLLNLTPERKLKISEYSKVIELINEMLTSHNKDLVSKIEGLSVMQIEDKIGVIHSLLRKDEVINLITQEKL